MPLLAYSVRRAVGALLVFLVVIWLIQLAVYHITGPGYFPGRGGVESLPLFAYPVIRFFQPGLAHEWDSAALEVGLGVLLLLGLGAAWRLRKRMAT